MYMYILNFVTYLNLLYILDTCTFYIKIELWYYTFVNHSHILTHTHQDTEREVSSYLSRKLSGRLAGIDMVDKEDLDLLNHLVGLKGRYLKLRFHSVEDLIKAKRDILPAVRKNREREKARSAYDPTLFTTRFVDE